MISNKFFNFTEFTRDKSTVFAELDALRDKAELNKPISIGLPGIDLLAVEAKIVEANLDTYLKYAEKMGLTQPPTIPTTPYLKNWFYTQDYTAVERVKKRFRNKIGELTNNQIRRAKKPKFIKSGMPLKGYETYIRNMDMVIPVVVAPGGWIIDINVLREDTGFRPNHSGTKRYFAATDITWGVLPNTGGQPNILFKKGDEIIGEQVVKYIFNKNVKGINAKPTVSTAIVETSDGLAFVPFELIEIKF